MKQCEFYQDGSNGDNTNSNLNQTQAAGIAVHIDRHRSELTHFGFTILAEIQKELPKRLHSIYGLNPADAQDLGGDIVSKCANDGPLWLCSMDERALWRIEKFKIDEKAILGRLLRPKFLIRRSIDFFRKQTAAVRDVRLTDSTNEVQIVDGEELPSIPLTYEQECKDDFRTLEFRDTLARIAGIISPHIVSGQHSIFEAIFQEPRALFNSADLAFLIAKDDSKTKQAIARRTGEVRKKIQECFLNTKVLVRLRPMIIRRLKHPERAIYDAVIRGDGSFDEKDIFHSLWPIEIKLFIPLTVSYGKHLQKPLERAIKRVATKLIRKIFKSILQELY